MILKRIVYQELVKWKNKKSRQPLIVMGARQVGKTYIINEFCKKEYQNTISFNLLNDSSIVDLFKQNISMEDKFRTLKVILGSEIDIESPDSIIFFDEIQESEEIITSLKFFNENYPNINIICAGSLLGIKFKRNSHSFPVGKVEMINMYPLNFKEFLLAFHQELLVKEIEYCFEMNTELVEPLHSTALQFYRYYLCVGGMPASVVNLVDANRDISKYDKSILHNILIAYLNDMNKYVTSNSESLKIERLYHSIPSQLAGISKKFQYSKVNGGSRKRDYETALDWLLAGGLVIKTDKVRTPEIPLRGFVDDDYFKLYLSDVGLLRELLGLHFGDILTDNLSSYKGAITENYVANEFTVTGIELNYWLSPGIAEIDFLLYSAQGIIPIEVKAKESVKSKSLNVYVKSYKPEYSIRISTRNFGFNNQIKSVPLYAVFCISEKEGNN